MAEVSAQTSPRLLWLDTAKAVGIILVFYGHLLEVLYLNGFTAVLPQFRSIYTFHMPLFFVLAGFVAARRREELSPYVSYRLKARMIPFWVFNLLALACLILVHAGHGGLQPARYVRGLLAMAGGVPSFNLLTWFLVCLFTVELFHFGGRRYFQTAWQQMGAAILFLLIGWAVTWFVSFRGRILLPKNFWYVHEALVAYGFYLLGAAWRQRGWMQGHGRLPLRLLVTALLVLVVGLTVSRNTGPFLTDIPIVLMSVSSHGHWFWFPVTAVAGTLFIILLSQLLPGNRPLLYLGQNSLVLMGLNGLFFEFFNVHIAALPIWAENGWLLTVQAILVTVLSIIVCLPVVYFANKYTPQLIGHPRRHGPWLPHLALPPIYEKEARPVERQSELP